jgi:hypothetical protein
VEREGDAQEPRFLPPEPGGPEPELSGKPPEPAPPPAPPPPQQTYGYPPPPPGQEGAYPPPPGYGGYQAPPPGWGHPPQWAWQPPVPDNGQAVTGFVFSIVGIGLLVISFWVGLGLGILATIGWILAIALGGIEGDSSGSPVHLRSAVAVLV